MFNHDCVSFSSSIVNVPYVIILSVSICISSLLVWISINTFKKIKNKKKNNYLPKDYTDIVGHGARCNSLWPGFVSSVNHGEQSVIALYCI